jgi:hypothetical protein
VRRLRRPAICCRCTPARDKRLIDPARDREVSARDVAVRGGSEQEDGLGDVFREGEAPGRCSFSHGLANLIGEAGEVVLGDGEAGADDVDEDAGCSCLPLQGGEEPVERSFAVE